eukprot:s3370_g5.t1
MAKADDLNTDWQRSAGDFSCSVCRRKRLTAQDFSKKQVDKALESLQSIPDKDIRNGQEIKTVLFITAVCKKCMEEKDQKEKEEAAARREEREQAIAETELEAPPRVEVTLASRPFGMTPASKGTGYVVLKTSEGKPAIKAGIRPGWRVADVAGQSVEDHRSGKGTLCDVALVESLALLKAMDMLPAAAACVAWRRLVDSTELWHIASPHLRVVDRIVWKSKICVRRSRGSMRSGILLGSRRQDELLACSGSHPLQTVLEEVAVRCVNLRNMNASRDDGLVPSVVREVAFLQSLARMRHSAFVRLVEVDVTDDWVHIVMSKVAKSFEDRASEPRDVGAGLKFG